MDPNNDVLLYFLNVSCFFIILGDEQHLLHVGNCQHGCGNKHACQEIMFPHHPLKKRFSEHVFGRSDLGPLRALSVASQASGLGKFPPPLMVAGKVELGAERIGSQLWGSKLSLFWTPPPTKKTQTDGEHPLLRRVRVGGARSPTHVDRTKSQPGRVFLFV